MRPRRSSCSLRSKSRYQLDAKLEIVVEKGLVWWPKHWNNNQVVGMVWSCSCSLRFQQIEFSLRMWNQNELNNQLGIPFGRNQINSCSFEKQCINQLENSGWSGLLDWSILLSFLKTWNQNIVGNELEVGKQSRNNNELKCSKSSFVAWNCCVRSLRIHRVNAFDNKLGTAVVKMDHGFLKKRLADQLTWLSLILLWRWWSRAWQLKRHSTMRGRPNLAAIGSGTLEWIWQSTWIWMYLFSWEAWRALPIGKHSLTRLRWDTWHTLPIRKCSLTCDEVTGLLPNENEPNKSILNFD